MASQSWEGTVYSMLDCLVQETLSHRFDHTVFLSLRGSSRLMNDCSHGQVRHFSLTLLRLRIYCRDIDIKDSVTLKMQTLYTYLPIHNTESVNPRFSMVKSRAKAANNLHGQLQELFASLDVTC